MDFKKVLNTLFKVLIPLLFGGLLLWYLYKDLDISEMWTTVKVGVRYDIILFSLVFGLAANIIRGFRWQLLINSIGEKAKRGNIINAILGNYALNLVLPRVGELWRCAAITKYDKIPFSKLFGTLLIDRVCDTLTVGLFTLLIFIFNFNFFAGFFARNPKIMDGFSQMFNSIWIYVSVIIIGLAIWFVFKYMNNFTLVRKAKSMCGNVWTGVKSIWLLKHKGLFLLLTLAIWSCYFFYFYITFHAFDFTRDLGIVVGLIAFTMSSIGVGVPVQGGIGAWHFMVIATLMCFGTSENDAATFAFVVHAIQTAWTGLCGLVSIIALPLTNKDRSSRK